MSWNNKEEKDSSVENDTDLFIYAWVKKLLAS